jgi:hypothetical protein
MDKMGSDHPMGQSTGLHDLAGKEMSPRARKYLDQYSKKVKRLEDQIKRIPFVVLVWGPGEQGGALFEKRRQIKEKLLGDGYAAVFSEDLEHLFSGSTLSARGRELLEAVKADMIVLLYGSPGAIAELHDFAQFRDIGSKMLVFIDSRYVEGYGFKGTLKDLDASYKNVFQYTSPQDLDECHLLTSVQERLNTMRVTKWSADHLG